MILAPLKYVNNPAQAQVLLLQIGLRLPKELSAVARSIWLRFVAQSGVLEEEFRCSTAASARLSPDLVAHCYRLSGTATEQGQKGTDRR